jgi:hypothetical protein
VTRKYPLNLFTKDSTGTLVAEISELSRKIDGKLSTSFVILEIDEEFFLKTTDRHGPDREIAGWRYEGTRGTEILVIND